MGKSAWKWKKVLLGRPPSYARAPWTLGMAWSATRSTGAGAHWWSAGAIDEIWCRGPMGGARNAKIRAKAL
jgi:hypothetical protein